MRPASEFTMNSSIRFPEGSPGHCPACEKPIDGNTSRIFGNTSCPYCGSELWYLVRNPGIHFYDHAAASAIRQRIQSIISRQLGVPVDKIPGDLEDLDLARLGADSLDTTELVMEILEEIDGYGDDNDTPPAATA